MFIISRNKLKPKKFKDYDDDFVMKIIKSERNNRPHRRQLIIKQLKELKRIIHNLNKMTQTDSPEEKGVQVEIGSDDLRTIRMNDGDTKGSHC